jgi:peptide-methionine (S)-S-oxide reductase
VNTDPTADLDQLLARVPEGWTRFEVDGRPWAVSRVARADGRSVTLEAEQLGSGDRFGANVWLTSSGPVLKPCEVPPEKVLGLLRALPDSIESSRRLGRR